MVISTVGVQIREPSPWARPVAEAFPAEVIGGWWCLGRTLRMNTLYSEQWKNHIKTCPALGGFVAEGNVRLYTKESAFIPRSFAPQRGVFGRAWTEFNRQVLHPSCVPQ